MATADTTRRQYTHPGLGIARNVATTTDLQRPCRQVSQFADQLTVAWLSDAGSPNAMAAQHDYLLANAPLLKAVVTMVPQHMCMQESQVRCASMASLLAGSCAEIDRVARCQHDTPTGAPGCR